jgi:hypothetical protein
MSSVPIEPRTYFTDLSPFNQESNWIVSVWERYIPINEIHFEHFVYPLNHSILAYFLRTPYNTITYNVETICPPICYGEGDTEQAAIQNWNRQFHNKFQELYTKLHWERTKEEQSLWDIFESIVNLVEYRRQTPQLFQQTGKLIEKSNANEKAVKIEWVEGSNDIVNNYPQEILSLKVGDYFRANVLREYKTDQLISIISIEQADYHNNTLSDKDLKIWIDSLPSLENVKNTKIWK